MTVAQFSTGVAVVKVVGVVVVKVVVGVAVVKVVVVV